MRKTSQNRTIAASVAALVLLAGGCTMKEQETPDLTGPSEFALSVTVSVDRDILPADGSSRSIVTVTAKGPNGEPRADVRLRNEIVVNGVVTDFGTLSERNSRTGADGTATFSYTAPPASAAAVDDFTVVDIFVWPVGNDFNNSTPRTASIRLVPPGVVIPPFGLTPSFTTAPAAALDNQPVLFDASESKPTGGIVSFTWNFGDGHTGSGMTTTHAFAAPGTFFPMLTIEDQFGRRASTTRTVTITANNIPTAAFVISPTNPRVNTQVNFNASGSVAATGRQIVSYRWDFGDGTPIVTTGGPTVSHVFTTAGSYAVTLVVTDDSGKSASVSITVTIAP